MGLVKDYLQSLIQRQVDDHRLVIWFDPEHHYETVVSELTLPGVTIQSYERSFFALRYAIDSLLDGEDPPRLVVYVPLSEEDTHDALIELTTIGVVLKPGQNPMQRNTRLSVVAKWALKDVLGTEQINEVVKLVETGKFVLADLDGMNDQQGDSAVVSTIF